MPGLEEHPEPTTLQPKEETSENVQDEEQSRELTQTDRINQRLLKSFLERMNNGNILSNSNLDESDSDNGSFDDTN